jgi:hypothetical protein
MIARNLRRWPGVNGWSSRLDDDWDLIVVTRGKFTASTSDGHLRSTDKQAQQLNRSIVWNENYSDYGGQVDAEVRHLFLSVSTKLEPHKRRYQPKN